MGIRGVRLGGKECTVPHLRGGGQRVTPGHQDGYRQSFLPD